ncbi:MAG: hypothetical protein ACKPJO_19070 [Dolichospermum sp.]
MGNYYAFAALKSDGSVVTWGDSSYGGDSSSVSSRLTSGVTQIFSTLCICGAKKRWLCCYLGSRLGGREQQ